MGMTTHDKLWDKLILRLRKMGYEECGIQGYTELPIMLAFEQGKLIGWNIGVPAHWEPVNMAERIAACREGLTIDRG